MKIIISLLLSLAILCSALGLCISAACDYIIPNPPITVAISSPTVDGNITDDEGWSEPAYMNEDTTFSHWSHYSFQVWAESRFALDKNGFYFTANILEGIAAYTPTYDSPSWTDSRCPLETEMKDNVTPDADRFILHIDPLRKFYDGRLLGGVDYTPQYTVCIDTDGNIHIQGHDKVITDRVIAKGSFTDGGWCFEAFIPWDIIIDDVYTLSEPYYNPYDYGNYVVTVDEIISNKAQIKVGMQYDDRYNGTDGKRKNGYSYFTPPPVKRDGTPNDSIINGVEVLGIDLTVSNTCRTDGEHDFSEWIRVKAPTYYEKGKEIALCNICGTTTHREVDKLAVRFNFSDVRNGAWYYDGVLYCVQMGYMNGMSSTRFSPNTALTREQCVLILANIMGVNTDSYKDTETQFTDVPTGKWYSGAVAWAAGKGYVGGITKELFGTGMNIQRAAFARLLYTAAHDMGMDMTPRADLSCYTDHEQIPNWAYPHISWAVANNIITSTKEDSLVVSPYTTLTRAQCATMLWKLGQIVDKRGD